MADVSLTRKPARELARLIRARAVSPVEVLDAHLAAIAAFNPRLNAIVTLAAEQARDAARAAENAVMTGAQLGALHGLPLAIKDITPTAGIRTTFASPLFKDNVPAEDAEVVRRLKAAGAIVLAKTNTPEFACGANTDNALFGPTRNPWNEALSPAGSSGGSAVAVATGMVPLAQGTDFGGSIRVPAAFCGIVGIRPTPGLIPNHPMPLAWDPGQVHGALGRDAEDVALMLDSMVGFSRVSPISVAPPWSSALVPVERRTDANGLRVAYVSDIAGIGVDAEIDAICLRAAETLRELGAQVEKIAFDASDGRDAYGTWRGVWMVGQQYGNLGEIERFGPNLKGSVAGRLEDHRDRDRGRGAQAAGAVSPLPRAVRALRRPAHAGRAGEAVPGRDELSDRDQRAKARQLPRLDCAGVSDHAGQPARRQRARRLDGGRPAGRDADRGPAVRGAADSWRRQTDPAKQRDTRLLWSGMIDSAGRGYRARAAASIAARMRAGVSGRSCTSTPSGRSASLTAQTIAAGGPTAPPSPSPLMPNSV